MTIRIGQNSISLSVQRQLRSNTEELGRIFERLSTGLRINRASDDAAGLSLSEGLNVERRLLGQAIRNVNDGISTVNIAEAATGQLVGIVTRIVELAEQASNGTLSDSQRQALDDEAQALRLEYIRIVESTEFNNLNLLDGSVPTLSLQAGVDASANSRIDVMLSQISTDFASSVTMTTGDGTFQNPLVRGTSGGFISNLIAVDINGDGNLDLLGTAQVADSVIIHLGNGDGTYTGYTTVPSVNVAHEVEAVDLNGDGDLDLIVASRDVSGSNIEVHLGNGDGTFGAGTAVDTGTDLPMSVELGDVNGDGDLDLVTAHSGNNVVSVQLGSGDGTFAAASNLFYGGNPNNNSVELADLNGDGDLDIITEGNNGLDVRLGNGDGTFAASISHTATGVELEAVDVDNDGILDMIMTGTVGSRILLGNGDGTFQAAMVKGAGTTSDVQNLDLVVADFNGDGYVDFARTAADDNRIDVYLNDGDGTFAARVSYAAGTTPSGLAAGDVDGDGVPDLIAMTETSGEVQTLIANTETTTTDIVFSLTTQEYARATLTLMQERLAELTQAQGELGASASRLFQ